MELRWHLEVPVEVVGEAGVAVGPLYEECRQVPRGHLELEGLARVEGGGQEGDLDQLHEVELQVLVRGLGQPPHGVPAPPRLHPPTNQPDPAPAEVGVLPVGPHQLQGVLHVHGRPVASDELHGLLRLHHHRPVDALNELRHRLLVLGEVVPGGVEEEDEEQRAPVAPDEVQLLAGEGLGGGRAQHLRQPVPHLRVRLEVALVDASSGGPRQPVVLRFHQVLQPNLGVGQGDERAAGRRRHLAVPAGLEVDHGDGQAHVHCLRELHVEVHLGAGRLLPLPDPLHLGEGEPVQPVDGWDLASMVLLGELGQPVVLLLVAVHHLAGRVGAAGGARPHHQVHHAGPQDTLLAEHGDAGAADRLPLPGPGAVEDGEAEEGVGGEGGGNRRGDCSTSKGTNYSFIL